MSSRHWRQFAAIAASSRNALMGFDRWSAISMYTVHELCDIASHPSQNCYQSVTSTRPLVWLGVISDKKLHQAHLALPLPGTPRAVSTVRSEFSSGSRRTTLVKRSLAVMALQSNPVMFSLSVCSDQFHCHFNDALPRSTCLFTVQCVPPTNSASSCDGRRERTFSERLTSHRGP